MIYNANTAGMSLNGLLKSEKQRVLIANEKRIWKDRKNIENYTKEK